MADADETVVREGEGEDPIDEAAAGWVARLSSPDATDGDRAAFEAWRAADPAHVAAYAEMVALWRKLGHAPDLRQRHGAQKRLAGLAVATIRPSAVGPTRTTSPACWPCHSTS